MSVYTIPTPLNMPANEAEFRVRELNEQADRMQFEREQLQAGQVQEIGQTERELIIEARGITEAMIRTRADALSAWNATNSEAA